MLNDKFRLICLALFILNSALYVVTELSVWLFGMIATMGFYLETTITLRLMEVMDNGKHK